jgi:beta-lactam-binding protein with PASTA domain
MATFGIICLIILVGAGILVYLMKTGKIGDRDKDFIPDVVEDSVEEAKKRVQSVKIEAKQVGKAVKNAAKEIKDVAKAAAGKKRRGRPSKK